MISILIPTYNYNVFPLVWRLQEELAVANFPCEILVGDDASPNPPPENARLQTMNSVSFFKAEMNLGRTAMRDWLGEKAKYDHLLFMDADVMPKHPNFIERYKAAIGNDVIFGGIGYHEEPPSEDKMLRWHYGREREMVSIAERVKHPYLTINSGCFMIKKELFLSVNKKLQLKAYGLDNYFKELLRMQNASVSHIENPVYHLGLESNEQFLKKSLQAIDTTVYLEKEKLLKDDLRPIQKSYLKLKKWGLAGLFFNSMSLWKKKMERNFMSERPNLFWFDLYRLRYYIQLKRSKDA